jgi:hypothetical protein
MTGAQEWSARKRTDQLVRPCRLTCYAKPWWCSCGAGVWKAAWPSEDSTALACKRSLHSVEATLIFPPRECVALRATLKLVVGRTDRRDLSALALQTDHAFDAVEGDPESLKLLVL